MMSWKSILCAALTFILIFNSPAIADVVVVSDKFSSLLDNSKNPMVSTISASRTQMERVLCGNGQMDFDNNDYIIISGKALSFEGKNCDYDSVLGFIVGFDAAIVSSNNRDILSNKDIRLGHIWLALSKYIPVNGQLVQNPYKKWSQIDHRFPETPIEVFLPSQISASRDIVFEKIIIPGCKEIMKTSGLHMHSCTELRDDGSVLDYDEGFVRGNDSIFITDYKNSFDKKYNNSRQNSVTLNGVYPSSETISEAKYPAISPVYVYAKRNPSSPTSVNEVLASLGQAMSPSGPFEQHNIIIAPRADDECNPPKPQCPKDGSCPQSMQARVLHCCPKNGRCPQNALDAMRK